MTLKSSRPQRRRVSFKIHKLLGLIISVPIIIIAFTGVLLVYQDALAPILYPKHYCNSDTNIKNSTIDYKEFIVELERERPINRVFFPTQYRETVAVMFADEDCYHFYSSSSGNYQASMTNLRGIFKPILSLHRRFMIDSWGSLFVGIITLIFWLFIVITGVLIFFPRGFSLKRKLFRIKRSNFVWSSHRVLGLFAVIPLLILGVSGSYFTFPKIYSEVAGIIWRDKDAAPPVSRHSVAKDASSELETRESITMSVAFEKMRESRSILYDDYSYSYIMKSSGERARVSLGYENFTPSVGMPQRANLSLNPYSGDIIRHRENNELKGKSKALRTLVYLHMGKVGGPVVRVIWFISTLILVWLTISGVRLFLRRRH